MTENKRTLSEEIARAKELLKIPDTVGHITLQRDDMMSVMVYLYYHASATIGTARFADIARAAANRFHGI